MKSHYDTIVVGGGIVGASAAYYLAKTGQRVALLDKGRVAGEQSSRNWGAVRAQGRNRTEIPMMLDSIEIWKGIEAELGESIDWCQNGQMLIAYDENHLAQLEALLPTAKEFGIPSRILSPSEINQTLPYYQGINCRGALFNPLDGCAEPEKAAPAFARGAKKHGCDVLEYCAVNNIDMEGGSVTGVISETGRLKADNVVLASGAWTTKLLKPLGINHPSLWIRGSVGRTSPLPIELRKLVVWGATAYRQRKDSRVNIAVSEDGFHDVMKDSFRYGHHYLSLAKKNWKLLRLSLGRPIIQDLLGEFSDFTTHRTLDPRPDWSGLERARRKFIEEYPKAKNIIFERAWAGYIDYMPDELPVIDMPSAVSGLVVAAGLSGNGFGFGPIVGRTISDLILKGQSDYDLNPFTSDRFN
jgi:glycine/D-amino acid oxidase-like deaminating enzyme